MSTAPEEFEKLQKLLKLKRHEQPPPGYFNNFSTHVIHRLERHEEKHYNRWGEAAWLVRFLGTLETNPVAAGVFGMSVCGLLIAGIAYSQVRTPADYSVSSNLAIDVAAANNNSMQTGVARSSMVDSLAPAVAVFETNATSLDSLGTPSAKQVNWQVNQ